MARTNALRAGILLASGLLASASAFGLVLGDISLSSGLNEPLEAVIELDSLEGVEASAITVTVGDQEAYDRVNMDRPPLLDDIRFTVEVDDEDEGRIRLSSTQQVSEPFLNLIISVNEPGGITLREYTLLMELPAQSAVTQAPAPAVPTVATQAAPAGQDSYTVGAGDTLYEIAQNTRPDSSIGVEQMMLAIQRANPDAFIGNNINRLISGRVLRIPSQQDIAAIEPRAAAAQVAQQNRELGGQPLVAGGNAANNGAGETRDQLSVLSGDNAPNAGGSSDLAATITALENELMLSEESLDRARIENLELNNRLSALQEQIDLLENIIAIEDERIAGLQAELARQADATAAALASADTAASELAEINEAPRSGLTGLLSNVVVLLGALVVLVLLVLAFLFSRRRQAQAAAEASAFNPALADEEVDLVEEKPGLLAGLLARFRRKDEEEDDLTDEEADAIVAAQYEKAAAAVPQPVAPQPKKNSADSLLDEMGIDEEMLSLDDALDDIDSDHAEESAEVFEPLDDAAAEAVAPDVIEPLETAQSAEQQQDSEYALNAADAALAAIDAETEADGVQSEAVEFTTADMPAPVDVPEEAVVDDSTETFEFTLKDLPEESTAATPAETAEQIESFDFKLSTPAPAAQSEPAAPAAAETLEVIAFPSAGAAPAPEPEPEPEPESEPETPPAPEEDLSLELGDLSFDDTMLTGENEEGESEYKPRTGNECDTKLDLATAYEAMGDVVEAIEILDEVIAEGSPEQVETAQRLKETWQASL